MTGILEHLKNNIISQKVIQIYEFMKTKNKYRNFSDLINIVNGFFHLLGRCTKKKWIQRILIYFY